MYECDIKIPCDECDLAGNCSYECSMIALRTNLEAEYLNSMQEISIRCRLIANTEEQEHTCKFCYYQDFEPDAYPCSRCIRNKPMDDMWQQRSKSMSDDEVAELLKNIFGDECACNYNGIDEWLPECCKYVKTGECPDPKNNGCWKQFIAQGGVEHIKERAKEQEDG